MWLVNRHRRNCKNSWTDRDAICSVDSGRPKEPYIRWGPDPPCEGANDRWLAERARSTILLQRNPSFGPIAFQLQEKNDKMWCTYLVINNVNLRTLWTSLVVSVTVIFWQSNKFSQNLSLSLKSINVLVHRHQKSYSCHNISHCIYARTCLTYQQVSL